MARSILAALALWATLGGAAVPAQAHAVSGARPASAPGQGDALSDPALQGAAVLAFMGVQPGWRVADIVPGRFTGALARAVGSAGKVYAVEPAEVVKVHPDVLTRLQALAAKTPNVEVSTPAIDAPALSAGLDAVFIRQNYHDLHDAFMGPANVGVFDRNVYAALRPGGVFIVLDHAAAAGSGLRDTDTLHRIDPAAVKAEVTAAGFVFEGESRVLANPADDHSLRIFDPAIRGRTDQFLYRFRKPA